MGQRQQRRLHHNSKVAKDPHREVCRHRTSKRSRGITRFRLEGNTNEKGFGKALTGEESWHALKVNRGVQVFAQKGGLSISRGKYPSVAEHR